MEYCCYQGPLSPDIKATFSKGAALLKVREWLSKVEKIKPPEKSFKPSDTAVTATTQSKDMSEGREPPEEGFFFFNFGSLTTTKLKPPKKSG